MLRNEFGSLLVRVEVVEPLDLDASVRDRRRERRGRSLVRNRWAIASAAENRKAECHGRRGSALEPVHLVVRAFFVQGDAPERRAAARLLRTNHDRLDSRRADARSGMDAPGGAPVPEIV